ncbi:MAG: ATP-dependent Clp protease adaptor ClpS [Anaerolineales bacterium]
MVRRNLWPDTTPDTEQDTDRDTDQSPDWRVDDSLGERTRVLLHNDDVTPFDFVIVVLRTIFFFASREAERITAQAHFNGVAYVMTLAHEEAKYRVGKAHGMARAAGYPLTFTIEPEPS